MSLNASFAGRTTRADRRRLSGGSRGLDIFVGLAIVIAGLLIATLGISTLYDLSLSLATPNAAVGFGIAVFGCGLVLGITTLIYLVRIILGRSSFVAPIVGLVVSSILLFVAYEVMLS